MVQKLEHLRLDVVSDEFELTFLKDPLTLLDPVF